MMNRRTALKQLTLGLGMSLAELTNPRHTWATAQADERTIISGNREFATELYGHLRGQAGNLFLSPYSISTALAMTYAGARGQTAQEMARTLHFPTDPAALAHAYATVIANLKNAGKKSGCELYNANALWGQQSYPFLPGFLKLNQKNFEAGLFEVDFVGHAEEARARINTWVEKQTREKIKDLLQRGILGPDTRLVLTNAIYFKSNWQSQFSKKATQKGPFTEAADRQYSVPMMHQSAQFGYLDSDTFTALDLPYRGRELSMVLFLPKRVDGLVDFEKTLTAGKLAEWLPQLRPGKVEVTLPRFKITAQFQLASVLSAMGMPTAFSRGADFTGMTASRELFISAVVHKAYVDVQEEGTEAAAATGVVMTRLSAPVNVRQFRADHPFLFLIREVRTNNVLFLGRVTDPRTAPA